jgi:hypothetical protein
VLLLAAVTFLSFSGRTELWIPDLLAELAG